MQLSVIIVNYNVKYFLEQCLFTVLNAVSGIKAEVIVVDNDSSDGSVSWLQPQFPGVHFISNRTNIGFAKANNQALAVCSGEYVLFLNPDTLIPEEALQKSLAYISTHPETASLGMRMIDGNGRFLAESKRSFPSPMAAFFKLAGLAALFPRSRFFNRYALGNTNEYQTQRVSVLAGACMLVRKEILDRLDGFDEDYFMYGEDIDLSYRIQQAGFQNHYFAGTSILHFKGKSSRRESLAYVKNFYGAMMLFVKKHYQKGTAKNYALFIKPAIAARALLAAAIRIARPVFFWKERLKNSPGSLLQKTARLHTQTVVVADEKEYADLQQRFLQGGKTIPARISVEHPAKNVLCSLQELAAFRKDKRIEEIIFCEGALSMSAILSQIQILADGHTRFFFHTKGSRSIIGRDGPLPAIIETGK